MTAHHYFLQLSLIFMLGFGVSCVDIPVEVTLSKSIVFNESRVKKLVDNVYNRMAAINLGPAASMPAPKIDAKECNKAFGIWLAEQFTKGIVPKRLITPLDYAKGTTNPLIGQCKNINLDLEFSEAVKEVVKNQAGTQEGTILKLDKFRDSLNSDECSKNFAKEDDPRITVKNIGFWVKKNTLNIHAPSYNIYYSTRPISNEELAPHQAEKNLIEGGHMVAFAKSTSFAPRFEGYSPLEYIDGIEGFKKIRSKFAGLQPDIIALPEIIIANPETTMVNDEEFFIVPKGLLALYITLEISVKAKLSDALCALRVYKEEEKLKDEERRRAFEEEGN